ncbi:MAG: hypothetical protein ABIP41_03770 [Croceibacterium sp.]
MIAWDTPTFAILSIGCLVLALVGYRHQRAGWKKTLILAGAWIAIIAVVAGVFAAIRP